MVRIVPPQPPKPGPATPVTAPQAQPAASAPAPTQAATAPADSPYTRTGPGPLASIRMRWTLRAVGSITFVVDETMGDSGAPVTSPPMSREAAIKLIDERAQAAHERYALLRNDLAWPEDTADEPAKPATVMPPVPPPLD